ncbi:MAG: hypothetical protein DELT_02197 [Desulfovibrio sp.]
MIPCQICGKDSGAHWVTGYIPAPDSQKMALCAAHDTPENRRAIHAAWYASMLDTINTATKNAAYFATRGSLFMLSINFTAGGSLSLPCLGATITDHNTLQVTAPDGTLSFFPMQHVRRYDLTPVIPDDIQPQH